MDEQKVLLIRDSEINSILDGLENEDTPFMLETLYIEPPDRAEQVVQKLMHNSYDLVVYPEAFDLIHSIRKKYLGPAVSYGDIEIDEYSGNGFLDMFSMEKSLDLIDAIEDYLD